MKVAVCVSGQPRNVEKAYHEHILPNLLELNQPDVFVHCWFDPAQAGKPYINAGGHVASTPIPERIDQVIRRLYQPTMTIFQKQIEFDEKDYNERKYPGIVPFYSLSQRYSIFHAEMLKRQWERDRKFVYDAVVRLRFDYALHDKIHASEFDMEYLNLPNRCPHPNSVDDTFAISSSPNMDIYASLHTYIDEYYREDGITFCDELLLAHHLQKHDVSVRKHNISYDLMRT
jgi:hypothetical protein